MDLNELRDVVYLAAGGRQMKQHSMIIDGFLDNPELARDHLLAQPMMALI